MHAFSSRYYILECIWKTQKRMRNEEDSANVTMHLLLIFFRLCIFASFFFFFGLFRFRSTERRSKCRDFRYVYLFVRFTRRFQNRLYFFSVFLFGFCFFPGNNDTMQMKQGQCEWKRACKLRKDKSKKKEP